MKYIVITSKHHDGFAMYKSRASTYNVTDSTPFAKDPIKLLAAETKKQGLKFCVYYSILDWHHPSQFVDAPGKYPTAGNRETRMSPGQKPEYVKYMKAQLKELITNYDPAVLWFDGEWQDWWTEEDGRDLYNYLHGLKPSIIINNRIGKGRKGMEGLNKDDREYTGDFGTPEQQIPANGLPGVDWESCMTLNDTWGFKSYDNHWKSSETILRNLIDIASKGGNYLLNVGPTSHGEIPAPSAERLAQVGQWMRVNGDSIYGSGPSPFKTQLAFGRATSKPGKVFLEVFDWPADGRLQVPTWGKKVRRVRLMDGNRALKFEQGSESVSIETPKTPSNPIASVIVIETKPERQ